ncbi:outer membrane biogenesis protein BamB [Anatilimnocola aggregata]|uniref:Outer membrane biogenesis protein BamB n=1 Tax=Anatilimnocola aggregata TaxID=2528021 RepID=A0A517YDC9_9BACT|nr:PQQ-binding-like beta-propeller repeat protein [Anatilimnocola aggregata]QDU28241.1 outer membrane biogenesis protein BamB [Anatilimnocola aggregata]
MLHGRFAACRSEAPPVLLAGLLLAAIACLAPVVASAQINPTTESTGTIIRPATRELRQLLNRARRALDEQDYPAAVQALEELLTDSSLDDYFLAPPGQPDAQLSVKSLGNQLLGTLPAPARQLYETQVGHDARQKLNDALTARDLPGVAEVARRYVHTKAGYEAAFLLGRVEMDQGRTLAAAMLLQPLCEQGPARDMLDPELSVLTATAWSHARRPDKARETLIALRTRTPRVKVRLMDGETPLFEKDDDALTWLDNVAGRGLAPAAIVANQWITFRGDEARNAATAGGLPLVNSEWHYPTINEPDMHKRIAQIARGLQDRGDSLVPAIQPLAFATTSRTGEKTNYIVVRTPEHVRGISLKTGKVAWVHPWNDTPQTNAAKLSQGAQQQASARESQMRQRLWDDNLYGQMSSDGTQLYFVDDLEYMSPTNPNMRGVWIGARPNMGTKGANQLRALNLRRQGTLCWQIGGEGGGDDPSLAGAFFLGAPLAIADRLYVLAEFQGEMRLLCLSPETGALEWKQQLGSIPDESLNIRYDATRRLAGASPSFADGMIICPTSAGAVVAIDLGTRALKWNYTYDRNDLATRPSRGIITSSGGTPAASPGRWLDSSAVIADGSVVVTPVESQFLHCLDLVTGKPRWPPLKREDFLFVGCIHNGKAILVSKNRVKAIQLSDGKEAWSTPVDPQAELVTGRGYYSGSHYYLPTTGQQLLKLDLDSGKVNERARTEFALGNLTSFEGQVVSVGSDQIATFYLADHLRSQVEKDLAANPKNVRALARMGELLLTDNKIDESLRLLREANALQPEDAKVRGLLARVMLVLLRSDFMKHRELVADASQLIDDPTQRRELLRLQAVGLHKAGLVTESLEAFVMLADELQTANTPDDNTAQMEYIDNRLQVRTSRWLQARLSELYRGSNEADRARLQERLEARLAMCIKTGTLTSARRFVEVYGFHPLADRARLQLVENLLTEGNLLEAELRAGELRESADPGYRAAGLAALITAYQKAQRPLLAAEYYAELQKLLASDPVAATHAAGPFVAKLVIDNTDQKTLVLDHWPAGRVTKVEGNIDPNRARPYMNNFNVYLTEFTGAAPRGMRALYDPSQQALQVVDSLGKTIAQAPIRRSDGIYRRSYSIPYSGLVGRAAGHIVVVHTGGEVLAIDALRPNRATAEPILWRGEVVSLDMLTAAVSYSQLRQVTNPVTGNRTVAFDQSGQTNCQPGPVTPSGVVYQRSRQLICVDPISGETMWERGGVDPACDLFGDDEYVFAVPPNTDQATVYSMLDGSVVGKRTVPKSNTRLTTNGRRILAWEQVGQSLQLRLTDPWSEGDDLWKLETKIGAKGQVLDGDEFAVLENTGKFTVISLQSGQVLVASQLVAEATLTSLNVLRSQEQYTVLANQPIADSVPGLMTTPLSGGGMPGQQAHGRVYAIDRITGKQRWQTPAFVAQHGLPWDQPVDAPLMVFIRNRRGNNSGNWAANLLCIDKRDGSIAYEGDIANAQANMCEVQADFEKQAVQVTTWVQPGTMRVTLIKLSDEPAAPQAPAQTGNLSSLMAGLPQGDLVKPTEGLFGRVDPARGANGIMPVMGPNGLPVRGLPPNLPPQILERLKQLQQKGQLPPGFPPLPADKPADPNDNDPFK